MSMNARTTPRRLYKLAAVRHSDFSGMSEYERRTWSTLIEQALWI
jgi:hypothetical protein